MPNFSAAGPAKMSLGAMQVPLSASCTARSVIFRRLATTRSTIPHPPIATTLSHIGRTKNHLATLFFSVSDN
jgi:hypothetical protein